MQYEITHVHAGKGDAGRYFCLPVDWRWSSKHHIQPQQPRRRMARGRWVESKADRVGLERPVRPVDCGTVW